MGQEFGGNMIIPGTRNMMYVFVANKQPIGDKSSRGEDAKWYLTTWDKLEFTSIFLGGKVKSKKDDTHPFWLLWDRYDGEIDLVQTLGNNDINYGCSSIEFSGLINGVSVRSQGDSPSDNTLGAYDIDENKFPKNRIRGFFYLADILSTGGWYRFEYPMFRDVEFWGIPNTPIDVYRDKSMTDVDYPSLNNPEDYARIPEGGIRERKREDNNIVKYNISDGDYRVWAPEDKGPITGLIDYTDGKDYPSYKYSWWKMLNISGCFFRVDLIDRTLGSRVAVRGPATRIRLWYTNSYPFIADGDDIAINHYYGGLPI